MIEHKRSIRINGRTAGQSLELAHNTVMAKYSSGESDLPFWTLAASLLWAVQDSSTESMRQAQNVADMATAAMDADEQDQGNRHSLLRSEWARLHIALADGNVVANGIRNTSGETVEIQPSEWPFLYLHWLDNTIRRSDKDDVAFSFVTLRAEQVRRWLNESAIPSGAKVYRRKKTETERPEAAQTRLAIDALGTLYPDGIPQTKGAVKAAMNALDNKFAELASAEGLNITPPKERKWRQIRNQRPLTPSS